MKTRSISNIMAAACCVFGLSVLFELFSSRCLYADGSHEFIRVLQAQNFVAFMWSRHFAFYIYEFPLVLAIKLGITQFSWLRLAFGLGCFLPWPLALLACYRISPRHFWLAAAGCAAGYLNAAFMAVGEHILAHALFWPSLFAILFGRPLKPVVGVILIACATALLFSYESQLILGIPLSLLALWRAGLERKENHRVAWTIFLVAAALFAAGVTIGVCSVLMPELPRNLYGFKAGSQTMLKHMGWTLSWTAAWMALAVAAFFSEALWKIISRKPGLFVLFTLVLVWGAWPLLAPHHWGDNGVQYDNRAMDTLVPLALLPVALMLRLRPQWLESRSCRLEPLAAALLLAQSLWQISATAHWRQDVVWLRQFLASNQGIIPLHATNLAADGMQGHDLRREALNERFDWTWPCLSLALAPSKNIQSFVCSEVFLVPYVRANFWQPFDPLVPKTLPDLRHYGINYNDYIAALNSAQKTNARH